MAKDAEKDTAKVKKTSRRSKTKRYGKTKANTSLVVLLYVLLGIALVGIGIGGFIVARTNDMRAELVPTVSNPNPGATHSLGAWDDTLELIEAPEDVDVDYYEDAEAVDVPIYNTGETADKYTFSVLVVVQDGSFKEAGVKKTDTIMLVSYNAVTQKIVATPFSRDCWLQIDGYGWNRLSAAYTFGGIGLVANTLNFNFGLGIENYVVTGTTELSQIIDKIGGIELTLSADEAAYINTACGDQALSLDDGAKRLGGEQAIAYALNRTTGGNGDFGRMDRQKLLMGGAFDAIKTQTNKSQLISLMSYMFERLSSNLKMSDILNLGYEVLTADSVELHSMRVPADETWMYGQKDGKTVIAMDIDENAALVNEAIYGQTQNKPTAAP